MEPSCKRQNIISIKKNEKNKNLTRSNSTTTEESERLQSVFERLAKPKHSKQNINF